MIFRHSIIHMDKEKRGVRITEEAETSEPKKRRMTALVLVLITLSIVIPFTFLSLFLAPEEHSEQFFTYKEFYENSHSMQLEDGDIVHIRDTFSDLWYNQSTEFTYMTFESMDKTRTAPWGYDAGIPEDITDEFDVWDRVEIELEISREVNSQGNPMLVAHITEIERV